jgi:18S rRNA (guanine1575-N7)-methyltransferase
MSKRPEHTAPPEIFYDDSEAKKYTANSRIAAIQVKSVMSMCAARTVSRVERFTPASACVECNIPHLAMTQTLLSERALELLALPDDGVPRLLLDLGCGSCLSSDVITEAGHAWVVRPAAALDHAQFMHATVTMVVG